mmetsp:Transcript_115757/g.327361  ORF Transcript_115757/g.327361 Transcript_115757/m.327361 type:complete len:349 (-) Transcript_115757:21-1067(-)
MNFEHRVRTHRPLGRRTRQRNENRRRCREKTRYGLLSGLERGWTPKRRRGRRHRLHARNRKHRHWNCNIRHELHRRSTSEKFSDQVFTELLHGLGRWQRHVCARALRQEDFSRRFTHETSEAVQILPIKRRDCVRELCHDVRAVRPNTTLDEAHVAHVLNRLQECLLRVALQALLPNFGLQREDAADLGTDFHNEDRHCGVRHESAWVCCLWSGLEAARRRARGVATGVDHPSHCVHRDLASLRQLLRKCAGAMGQAMALPPRDLGAAEESLGEAADKIRWLLRQLRRHKGGLRRREPRTSARLQPQSRKHQRREEPVASGRGHGDPRRPAGQCDSPPKRRLLVRNRV